MDEWVVDESMVDDLVLKQDETSLFGIEIGREISS
jgi:hypothetical protein